MQEWLTVCVTNPQNMKFTMLCGDNTIYSWPDRRNEENSAKWKTIDSFIDIQTMLE